VGCDIHIVLERQHADKWIGFRSFSPLPKRALELHNMVEIDVNSRSAYAYWKIENRDYDFFATLAGVRGEGPTPRNAGRCFGFV
jgi:hypothetical protein